VLFTGTPCQIAGIRTFLGDNYDNLTTVDLICHGVLSPDVATYHIKALEQEFGARATTVKFRDKQNGWKNHWLSLSILKRATIFPRGEGRPFL